MPKPEYEFHEPRENPWEPAFGEIPGAWQQILSRDPEKGDYTRLVRLDPGADTSAAGTLVHDFWEEVYIVRGDLTDLRLGETFRAGYYACRPPGMTHGPYRSPSGVLMVEFRYGFRK
ncbi:MAG TPA: cupin domain-containing protein [Methylomirabilota bacterium]|nr:cupin domain-containing protein [Methylomirabilota bacterium]